MVNMVLFIVWGAIAIGAVMASATSCTLSYQNISTHGSAQDVVDENQTASPDVKSDLQADVSVLPKGLNGHYGVAVKPPVMDSVGPK